MAITDNILSIGLWELFKRLVKPQTLTKLINKYGEAGLQKLLAENENGEAGIRATAEALELGKDSKLNGTWSPNLDSSNINKIRWMSGLDSTGIMQVKFNSGTIYEYYDVPQSLFLQFFDWPGSYGIFFVDNIKGRGTKTSNYAYAKIGQEAPAGTQRFKESGYKSTHKKYR